LKNLDVLRKGYFNTTRTFTRDFV